MAGSDSAGAGSLTQAAAGRHTRRVVLGAAATLGMLAPAAPALAAGLGERRPAEPASPVDGSGAGSPGPEPRQAGEIWGTSASGRGAGVRGNGHRGVAGEGTHSGVTGDGFVGVRGSSSIVDGDERGVGVLAEAVIPGSTALRADGPSEFNGVTRFARSGVATIPRGTSRVSVAGVSLTADTSILATLQDRVTGVVLHAVETDPAAGLITIFLTAPPPRDVRVAWLALG